MKVVPTLKKFEKRCTTVTSGLRLVTRRQTANTRRTAASHREKATKYPSHTMFEVYLLKLRSGDVRLQE